MMEYREERTAAVLGTAERLFAFEAKLDETIVAAADLIGFIPKARFDAMLAPKLGHDALSQIGSALELLMTARTSVITAHDQLLKDKLRLGLREVATGGWGKGPEEMMEAAPPALKVVKAEAA